MIRIKCINESPPVGKHTFDFDDEAQGITIPDDPKDTKAKYFILKCSICGTENKVRLKETETKTKSLGMSISIVKRSLDFM